MPIPNPQQIYQRVLENVGIDSPAYPLREYVREAVEGLSSDLDPLAILEITDTNLTLLLQMVTREQVRAIAGGVSKFEILGTDLPVIKGFAVPLSTDTEELIARRKRAALAQPVRDALLNLSPSEFEALWRILVGHLGGRHFVLSWQVR